MCDGILLVPTQFSIEMKISFLQFWWASFVMSQKYSWVNTHKEHVMETKQGTKVRFMLNHLSWANLHWSCLDTDSASQFLLLFIHFFLCPRYLKGIPLLVQGTPVLSVVHHTCNSLGLVGGPIACFFLLRVRGSDLSTRLASAYGSWNFISCLTERPWHVYFPHVV